MGKMKALGNWSLTELKEIETIEDLLWWFHDTVKNFKELNAGNSQK